VWGEIRSDEERETKSTAVYPSQGMTEECLTKKRGTTANRLSRGGGNRTPLARANARWRR